MITRHYLPKPEKFIGREDKIQEVLYELLETRAWIVSIEGLGGVGKTALALEVAHRIKDLNMYSGIVWVTAKESWLTPTIGRSFSSENDLKREILRVAGLEEAYADSDEMRARATSLLSDPQAPYLIIIDNLDTVEDPRVFDFLKTLREIEGGGKTKALFTSRVGIGEGAYTIKLEGLHEDEAIELIKIESEGRNVESLLGSSQERLREVSRRCAGLPLAIKWTVARMAKTGESLSEVLAELEKSEGDILRYIFELTLKQLSLDARRVLLTVPAFATTVPRKALSQITELSEAAMRGALGELHHSYLITEIRSQSQVIDGAKRYDVLPATRLLVRAIWDETPGLGEKDMLGAVDYYRRAWKLFSAGGHEGQVDDDYERLAKDDYQNTKRLIGWCFSNAYWPQVVDLADRVEPYLKNKGLLDDRLALCDLGMRAARYNSDGKGAARFRDSIGSVYKQRGLYDESKNIFSESLTFYRDINDRTKIAAILLQLGTLLEHQAAYSLSAIGIDEQRHYFSEALIQYEEAFSIFEDVNVPERVAQIEHLIGRVQRQLGNHDIAQKRLRQAVARKAEIGKPVPIAISKHELAKCLELQNEFKESEQLYTEAIRVLSQFGAVKDTANAKWGYSQLLFKLGRLKEAQSALSEAIDSYRSQGRFVKVELAKRELASIEELLIKEDSSEVDAILDGSVIETNDESEQGKPKDQDKALDPSQLFEMLQKHFNEDELNTLCFELRIDYDELSGRSKGGKIRELLLYLERTNRILELLSLCKRERPSAEWVTPSD